MKSQISAILIDSDKKAQDSIEEVLKSFGDGVRLLASASNLQQGINLIRTGPPHIVILDVKEVDQGVKETAFISSRFPQTSVFVTAAGKNPDWILKLIRAGANEYLTKPVVADELLDAIKKVSLLQSQMSGAHRTDGLVISVYNPSGGMGTTTIAVNLATLLALKGKRTALIDLDLCCGDAADFLDISPRYTLGSLAGRKGELDATFLKSVVVSHSTGLDFLNSPQELEEALSVDPELLQEILPLFRTLYDYTIIDASGPLFGCNLAALSASDQILFNTVLTLPALKTSKRYLSAMARGGLGDDRLRLVINRYTAKDDIKVADLEKVLNMKTYHSLPNAYLDAKASINKGVPLVAGLPKSPVRKSLEELLQKLIAEPRTVHAHAV